MQTEEKTEKRYLVVEVSNPARSYVRNEETGEERAEMLYTFAETDDLAKAFRLAAKYYRTSVAYRDPHNGVCVWDNQSDEWNAFVDPMDDPEYQSEALINVEAVGRGI